jgi:hypothetical protein
VYSQPHQNILLHPSAGKPKKTTKESSEDIGSNTLIIISNCTTVYAASCLRRLEFANLFSMRTGSEISDNETTNIVVLLLIMMK